MFRTVLGCALVLLLCGGLVAEDKKADAIDAKKIVGKWGPKDKKEGVSVVLEFTKDGKVTVIASVNGMESKLTGTYKVDGNKVTTMSGPDGKGRTETHTILKLTDTELVSKNENGKEETLVRVKDK